jgi:tRNA A-37 threonylcarbamoyl transferase component Bud32
MSDNRPIDLDIEGLQDPVEIGVGGFATVFKAYQPAFRRTVAVKVLATLNLDDAARERFERECQAMGSLSEHPNIVTVYGAGFTNSGRPYLVMAYLPGGSLQERIDRAPLSWQDATLAGVHLAGALETAHRAQIVHRDIKPGNVLMSAYGDAQLTDFGIARISGGHETRSGVITASMAHAPPEVLDGQRPTIAADVYSLGSTIFELIHGTPAFASTDDESMVPMLRRILTDPPPDLRPYGVPDQVCQVIERAMAKKPEQRQASAVQFGRELQAARRANGLDAGKLTVPADVSVDVEQGQEINFVAAPFTGQLDQAGAAPVSPAASAPTGPLPGVYAAGVGTAPMGAPVGAPTGQATQMPPGYQQIPVAPQQQPQPQQLVGAPVAPGGYGAPPGYQQAPPYTAPPATSGSGSKKGLLIGVATLIVLVILGGAGFAISRSSSGTNADVTTTTLAVTTTASTAAPTTTEEATTTEETTTTVAGYTAELEVQFVDECVKGNPSASAPTTTTPPQRRQLCRCVFKGIKDKVPYATFLQIQDDIQSDPKTDISKTAIGPIITDCHNQFPNS